MKIYNTLIIGCGYASVGYAMADRNTIICEEHQVCDANFYLPLSTFKYTPYTPKTKGGECLNNVFKDLSLFSGDMQNTNAFECAFCKYLVENNIDILLKCRVIKTDKMPDGIFDVTIQTNEGLSHIFARKILNSTGIYEQKFLTVLFKTHDIDSAKRSLLSAFENSKIEEAFYKDRYAIHIKIEDADENTAKYLIYKKWCKLDTDSKIVYIAPVFSGAEDKNNKLCDTNYKNPVEAFEAGYLFGEEAL